MEIPLLIPDMPQSDELIPYLRRIDTNRHYTNFGPLNQELEEKLKRHLSAQTQPIKSKLSITTVSNATAGLELAFTALDIPLAAKVIVPALTFPATATAIVRQGLVPVFTDVDPESWLMTPGIAHLALKSHPDARLIVPVAAFGVPIDTQAWKQFTHETGIPVIIDAAGAFENQIIEEKIHFVFSMHATKSFACGEGGFIATTDPFFSSRIKTLSNFGIDTLQRGKISAPGTNAKLSEYHAAVALCSLDRWPARRKLRIELLDYWIQQIQPLIKNSHIILQKETNKYSHSLLPLRFPKTCITELANYLEEKKIQTRRWYYPLLPMHPAFASYPLSSNLRFAKTLSEELLGMPFHLSLAKNDIATVVDALNSWFNMATKGDEKPLNYASML